MLKIVIKYDFECSFFSFVVLNSLLILVFAYGQTGSGKTYSISGHESWEKRGIIPRALSYLFDRKENLSKDLEIQIFISYLEIYNENAFDLLNAENIDRPFNKWDKVTFFFDEVNNNFDFKLYWDSTKLFWIFVCKITKE